MEEINGVSACRIDAKEWKSYGEQATAMAAVFGSEWQNPSLSDDEAARLFEKPSFLIIDGCTQRSAVLLLPFLQLYTSARMLALDRAGGELPPSAVVLCSFPYGAMLFRGDDDENQTLLLLPTVPL